jgi:hypothetical protein
VSIEVLALLSNNLANNRCSWWSRSHDVIETVGGKVVGLMHEVFLPLKPSLP